jgi:translation initiation factor IF-3
MFVPLVCGAFCFRTIFIFRRCCTISVKEHLINEDIRAKEVRMVGLEGEQLGIMSSQEALSYAYEKGVDLVLIAPQAVPPVCRAMDYGKFRFESMKKEKEARKKQQVVKVKEVQLSCRIDTHDFETRVNQAKRFLSDGDKVRAVVRFKGREMAHQEIGREMLERFEAALAECGSVDKKPSLDGRIMSMVVSPVKAK